MRDPQQAPPTSPARERVPVDIDGISQETLERIEADFRLAALRARQIVDGTRDPLL